MSTVAVIDIGTNSVKLTIAGLNPTLTSLYKDSVMTRLGKNVDRDGRLNDSSIATTVDTIKSFADKARQFGAKSIVAVGTSALRDAKNGPEVIEAIRVATGIDVEIITGKREAELSFLSVSGDPELEIDPEAGLLVFDIGGGSTELIYGASGGPKSYTSLDIGAVRLTERYLQSDPPTFDEYCQALDFADEELHKFDYAPLSVNSICGLGGTATTFAALIYQTKEVHGKTIALDDLEIWIERLRVMSLEQRRDVPFLEPQRADIIVAGGMILVSLLKMFGRESFRVSVQGMRYGLLLEMSKKEKAAND